MNEKTTSPGPMVETQPMPKQQPLMTFTKIEGHKTNPLNDLLEIAVEGEPGLGGAPHTYLMYWPNKNGQIQAHRLNFQNGPLPVNGVNGVTSEALLAILIHRHTCFQKGKFPSEQNAEAIKHMEAALTLFKQRTIDRHPSSNW